MLRTLTIVSFFAIGMAAPATAQSLSEQEARQVAENLLAAFDKAGMAKDAVAHAALYAADAILVTPREIIQGRDAIQKWRVEGLKFFTGNPSRLEKVAVIDHDVIVIAGSWSGTWQGPKGPVALQGHWSQTDVRDGDAWRIRMDTFNETEGPTQ